MRLRTYWLTPSEENALKALMRLDSADSPTMSSAGARNIRTRLLQSLPTIVSQLELAYKFIEKTQPESYVTTRGIGSDILARIRNIESHELDDVYVEQSPKKTGGLDDLYEPLEKRQKKMRRGEG